MYLTFRLIKSANDLYVSRTEIRKLGETSVLQAVTCRVFDHIKLIPTQSLHTLHYTTFKTLKLCTRAYTPGECAEVNVLSKLYSIEFIATFANIYL